MPLVEPGQELGTWRLEGLLGEGGNGEVWRARQENGQTAAIKVLRDARPSHTPLERFIRMPCRSLTL
jgi:serine/threonine protein kinase